MVFSKEEIERQARCFWGSTPRRLKRQREKYKVELEKLSQQPAIDMTEYRRYHLLIETISYVLDAVL